MKSREIVIRGYHCDSYGHVNNARYLELLEEARWEALTTAMESGFFERRDLLFVVVNINVNYRAEVQPNDRVVINTRLKEFGRKSITFYQTIQNQTTDKLAVDADVKFVLLKSRSKQMETIDEEIRELFTRLNDEN